MAIGSGMKLLFSTGIGGREETLLKEFQKLAPAAPLLQPIPDLALYLATLQRARAFVSGDTGPLHFAAALGVPTLALFGPSSPAQWAPIGPRHRFLTGKACSCGNVGICQSVNFCLATIIPERVFAELKHLSEPASAE